MITVLVVEDEPLVRQEIVQLTDWQSLGCTCIGGASCGKEGIELYNRYRPDIIITDIRMPEINGLEMIEIISEIAAATTGEVKTGFIILSGYSDFEYARRAMRSGVQEYIVKPVDDEELKAAILRIKRRILKQPEIQSPVLPEILPPYESSDKNSAASPSNLPQKNCHCLPVI